MLLIGTLAAALAMASANDEAWARFSAHHALARLNVGVEIGIAERTPGEPVYWIRRTIQKPRQKTQVSQVDTRSCPRMLAEIRSLHELQMPSANLPLLDPFVITADGTGYSLTMPVAYSNASIGDLTMTSNEDTPLAAWIDDALSILDSCMPK